MRHKKSLYIKMLALGLSCMLLLESFPAKAEPESAGNGTEARAGTDGAALNGADNQEAGEGTDGAALDGTGNQEAGVSEKVLHTVAENSSFRFDYDEEGADVYITDKRSGKVWSNTVAEDYYTEELANRNVMSQLMTVTYASSEGKISMVNVFDNGAAASNFKLSHRYEGETVILTVAVASGTVSFEIHMGINEDGFHYEIPRDSIQETGNDMLVNIQIMPTFGAAVGGEDGYILVPDGSGTLIYHKTYDDPNARLYMYPFYGTDVQDITEIEENKEQGYHNLMLPVYGISHGDGAMLAAVTEGEADTVLNIAPSGFRFSGLNRAYLTFNYRIYYSTVVNGSDYIQIVPHNYASDRSVQIFLLDGEHNAYSDMAVAYRGYLEDAGKLKAKDASGDIPMAVELVMGAGESSLFGKKLISATTYSQAAEIVSDLGGSVPGLSVILDGWGSGGCDTLPTSPSLEKKFGGKSGYKELLAACEKANVTLYLNMDFINADEKTGDFNNRKDTIRSGFGSVVNEDSRYLLNPARVLQDYYEEAVKERNLPENGSIRFDTVGSLLTYDHSKSDAASRTMLQAAYESVLEKAAEELGQVAVTGGNQYVLPYATLMSEIPYTNSDYYLGDKAVPFYQIVVHGSVDYTSSAGNHAYDLSYQKLKWIETGSIPYFILTYESPVVLNKTDRNDLFSSEYSVWKETVKEIAAEFNDRLSQVWNQKIVRHEETGGLTVITYEDGSRIYINYTKEPIEADGITVPAMDYSVVKGA